jgi:putative ABC transport system permease protein
MGIGIVILGLGAVMIGEMISGILRLNHVGGQLLCVVLGSLLFRLILGFTLSIGIDPIYLKLVVAVFVLITVSLPQLKRAA